MKGFCLQFFRKCTLLCVFFVSGVLVHCVQDNGGLNSFMSSLQTQVIWTQAGVAVDPVTVDSIRLTVTSQCAGTSVTKTFPYTAREGIVQVKTGCVFTLLCEGLGARGEVLYRGVVPNVTAESNSISVRVSAEICTPAPPDSLRGIPSGRSVKLVWKDKSNNESGFIIKRARASGSDARWTTLDTVTNPLFIDTFEIKRGIPYNYLVFSWNSVGVSVMPDSLTGFSLAANSLPEFISTKPDMDSIAEVDSVYTDTIRYHDVDFGDSLRLVLDTFPDGFSIKDSVVNWIPNVSQEGKRYMVRAIVSDQDSSRDTLTWSIKVQDTVLTALPPVFVTSVLDLKDSALTLGASYRDTVKAIDPEHGPVSYSKREAPLTASVDSLTGVVTWVVDSVGSQILFSIIARDTTDQKDTLSWTLSVY
jgi:hypothetical protein